MKRKIASKEHLWWHILKPEGYTRIVEYKKMPLQDVKGTSYAVEYPLPYNHSEEVEPYYPILTEHSQSLYIQYRELASKYSNLIACGRLADFLNIIIWIKH